jgi:putative hydrolase of the HAD superfamily
MSASKIPRPEIVVFDLGKVLLDFDYQLAISNIMARCEKPGCDLNSLINQSPLLFEYESGRLTNEDFFLAVKRATGFLGEQNDFEATFGNIFSEISPMVRVQQNLREQGIPTFIFSNTNDMAIRHIRANYPFFAHFSGYIFSYEVGAMKPESKIYDALEKVTRKHGAQICYLDDRLENVEAGAQRGWTSFLHQTPEQTARFLDSLGVLKGDAHLLVQQRGQ